MKAPTASEPFKILVTDLIDHDLIHTPTTVFGTHSGKRIEAVLTPDGTFLHRGRTYSSPSVAAGNAITATLGVSSIGRNYLSINGWKFWHVLDSDGTPRCLADLREELLQD